MKQKVLYLAVAALAMTACSQDETTSINQGKGIGFRTSADKITRGAEINNTNLNQIWVTALDAAGDNYFDKQLFSKGQEGTFLSSPAYYWPGDGSNLTFHAYAPSEEQIGGTLSFSSEATGLTGFSPNTDVSQQVDLIYATATGNKDGNEASGVQLDFDHMLSRITIQAKNDNEGYVYKVKGVRIGQPVSSGDLDFTTASWTLGDTKANYEVTYEQERTLETNVQNLMSAEEDDAMLIPQQLTAWDSESDESNTNAGAYLAVKINLTTKDGAQVYPSTPGEYAWAAVAIGTEWKAGEHYVYTLDFSEGAGKVDPEDPDKPGEDILGGPIKFTVDVAEWTETEGNDIGM